MNRQAFGAQYIRAVSQPRARRRQTIEHSRAGDGCAPQLRDGCRLKAGILLGKAALVRLVAAEKPVRHPSSSAVRSWAQGHGTPPSAVVCGIASALEVKHRRRHGGRLPRGDGL